MSQRRDLEQHLHALNETREIMNSMKSLALMETRKLTRLLTAQQEVANTITTMANDFRSHYHVTAPLPAGARQVVLLIGSERGFCGDFNRALLDRLDELKGGNGMQLITVGHKLCAKVEDEGRDAIRLAGAGIAEEVEAVLLNFSDTLAGLQRQGAIGLTVLHHGGADDGVHSTALLPPFQGAPPAAAYSHAPLLTLAPPQLFLKLIDEYLFAALHHLFHASLMAENRRRMQHLEGAIQHLDTQSSELTLKRNVLRQEEITEEIEIILLNTTRGQ